MNATKSLFVPTCLILALCCSAAAEADDCQEPGPDGACPVGTFELRYMDGSGPLGVCSVRNTCVDVESKLGPSPAFISCSETDPQVPTFTCEAWPQGDLSYTWVLDAGVVALDTPFAGGPERLVGCAGGTGRRVVSVTVTSPNGYSDTAFSQIPCD